MCEDVSLVRWSSQVLGRKSVRARSLVRDRL